MSTDPLMEDAPNVNPYVYCEDNPINMTDPDGRWPYPSWFNKAASYAKAAGQGVKNFGNKLASGLKNDVKGLYNAYSKLTTDPKVALKYAVNHSGPAILYNSVKHQLETPVKIVKKVASGDTKGAVTDYTEHLTEGAVALVGARGFKTSVKPAATKTAPSEVSTARANASPNVQEALNTLDEILANGGEVKMNPTKPNQELNMTVNQGDASLNIRVETHPLPPKYGGDGITPQRHLNVEPIPKSNNNLPDKGHKILE